MTTAQVVETLVTVNNNSPIQDYVHPDNQTQPTFEMTPEFKLSQRKNALIFKFSPQFFWRLRNEHRMSRLMMFTTQIWVVLHFMGKPVVASQMFCQAIRRLVWRICAWWRLLLLRLEFNMFFLSNLSLVIPRRFYTPNALEAKSWRLLVVAENDTIVKIALLKETWNVFNIAVWKENGNNSWFLAKISYNKWRKCLRMLRIIGLGPYCEWSFSSMWGGGLSPEFPPPNTGNSRLK